MIQKLYKTDGGIPEFTTGQCKGKTRLALEISLQGWKTMSRCLVADACKGYVQKNT